MELGIVRKIDELNRIVLPVEIRKNLNIEPETDLDVFIDTGKRTMTIRHSDEVCNICGTKASLIEFKEKEICMECMRLISKI